MLRCFLFCFLMVPSFLSAEVVAVRSGEHENFTRLVFPLPNSEMTWSLDQNVLRIDGEDLEFDFSRVFDRIPRTRLEAIRQEENSVVLDLNCVCETRAFRFSERSVVLDIADPTLEQETSADNETIAAVELETKRLTVDQEARKDLKQSVVGLDEHIKKEPKITELSENLRAELATAMEQSFLKPAKSREETNQDQEKETMERSTDIPNSVSNVSQQHNFELHASNNLDVFLQVELDDLNQRSKQHCAREKAVSFDQWDMETSPLEKVSVLRRGLVGEFDKVDSAVAIELASLLTYLTFGAEAREVLHLVPEHQDTKALVALSHLLEGNPHPAREFFAQQGACSDWHSFWSTMSGAESDLTEQQVKLALRMLGMFPDHLRRELGPILAHRFSDEKRFAEAEQALAFADRVSEDPTSKSSLMRGHVEAEKHQLQSASDLFETVASDGSESSPEALIELIELHRSQGLPPPENLISLVTAYSVEHRRTPYGPGLRRVSAIARAMTGHFNEAFLSLEEINQRDGSVQAQQVRNELISILLKDADDFELVRMTVLFDLPTHISGDLSLPLADRLLDAGFIDLAQVSYEKAPGSISQDHRVLRARLALAAGYPNRAQAELLGLNGSEVEALKGEAYEKADKMTDAAQVYQAAGMTEEVDRFAWLTGDWQTLERSSDDVHRRLARWKLAVEKSSSSEVAPQDPILLRNQRLLEDSLALRSLAEALLDQHEIGEISTQ